MKMVARTFVVGVAVMITACRDTAESGDEAADTGEVECNYGCNDEVAPICTTKLWNCSCHGIFGNEWLNVWPCPGCGSETQPPNDWCENTICGDPELFDDWRLQERPCYIGPSDDGVDESTSGAGACGSWDPGAEVSIVNRVYYLDQSFIDDLVANPWPLTECDDTRIDELATAPGFQIQDADAGELLYELGLRDGDIPLTINSLPLETYEDALNAFNALYLTEGETSYVLELKRGANNSPPSSMLTLP